MPQSYQAASLGARRGPGGTIKKYCSRLGKMVGLLGSDWGEGTHEASGACSLAMAKARPPTVAYS